MGILQKIMGSITGVDSSEALPPDAVLVDVRSPAEFASGHVQGALHMPLVRLLHDIGQIVPDKNTPVVVYCQSGARSASARRQMMDMGYQNVINGGGVRALAERMRRPVV
jgi:phage shock protein E